MGHLPSVARIEVSNMAIISSNSSREQNVSRETWMKGYYSAAILSLTNQQNRLVQGYTGL